MKRCLSMLTLACSANELNSKNLLPKPGGLTGLQKVRELQLEAVHSSLQVGAELTPLRTSRVSGVLFMSDQKLEREVNRRCVLDRTGPDYCGEEGAELEGVKSTESGSGGSASDEDRPGREAVPSPRWTGFRGEGGT